MEYVKLKNIAKYPTGKLDSNAAVEGGQYPFFTCAQTAAAIDTFAYDGEYVLLGGNNANGNFPVFYYKGKFNAYQRTYLIQPTSDNIDTKYLYYAVQLKLNQMRSNASGTATKFLTKPILDNINIEYRRIDEQRCISSILSAYDDLIENNNRRIKILEQMAENLYKEWFVRFRFPGHEQAEFENGIPKGWNISRLCELGISLDSGSRPKGGIDSSLKEGVPSLGAEAIQDIAQFDYSSVKYIPYDYYDKMKRGKFDGNAIFLYKDGAYIGKTTIFRNKFPFEQFAVNEHVFMIKANNSEYQNYLYLTLHQAEYFNQMQNLNRNAAQPGLSQGDIANIKIDVPSEPVVSLFNEIVDPIYDEIFELAKKNKNLTKQRDMLLPRLMSGKLEV